MNYGDEVTGIRKVTSEPASVSHFSVSGKLISVDGSKSLALYTLDGKKVASGLNGQVKAPCPGVFIIEADGQKIKIAIQ